MKARRGLTLFEVVISLAIFLVALVALWNLANAAANRASQTQLSTQASLMCQSKLAEAMVGLQELGSSDWQPIADVDNFFWKMNAAEQSVAGLFLVEISVKHESNGVLNADCTLTQYAMAPQNRGSTLDQATMPAAQASPAPSTDPAASSSGSSGSSGTGATGGGTGGFGGGTKTGGSGIPTGGGNSGGTGGTKTGGGSGSSGTGGS